MSMETDFRISLLLIEGIRAMRIALCRSMTMEKSLLVRLEKLSVPSYIEVLRNQSIQGLITLRGSGYITLD